MYNANLVRKKGGTQ
jgi:hypothetical protein